MDSFGIKNFNTEFVPGSMSRGKPYDHNREVQYSHKVPMGEMSTIRTNHVVANASAPANMVASRSTRKAPVIGGDGQF